MAKYNLYTKKTLNIYNYYLSPKFSCQLQLIIVFGGKSGGGGGDKCFCEKLRYISFLISIAEYVTIILMFVNHYGKYSVSS